MSYPLCVVGVIYRWSDGQWPRLEFLAVQRKDEDRYGLPGGKLDAGEDPQVGLIREIFEETGLNVSIDGKLLYTSIDDEGHEVQAYVCRPITTDFGPYFGPEGTQVRFIGADLLDLAYYTPYPKYNQAVHRCSNKSPTVTDTVNLNLKEFQMSKFNPAIPRTLSINPILATDSYKLSHPFAYPAYVRGMFSYIEARTKQDIIVPFGLQMWLAKVMSTPIHENHIDEAEAFAKAHGEPFKREPWEYIVDKYDGYFPVTIRAVPEGTPVKSGNALVTIECDDPEVFWIVSYIETALLRAVWYPTTIASADYAVKRELTHLYNVTGADKGLLPFSLHDFGGRGVTCAEQAEIGGAAHLVNFMGSDTIEGVRAANFYYDCPMSAFSVPASEHSIECSFGPSEADAIAYIDNMLNQYAKPGAIVSMVIDGYDVYREAQLLCTHFKDKIIASGAKVVFRPDSGDMMEVVPALLKMQAEAFGVTVNDKGFKKVNTVGIIQGDGVDRMTILGLLGKIATMGYAADNVVFGSGGGLLQKVNRDTYKFAQKASSILVQQNNGGIAGATESWVGISKDPITDPGKKSKEGRLSTFKHVMTGEISTLDIDKPISNEFTDMMVTVYENGNMFNMVTLDQVRANTGL